MAKPKKRRKFTRKEIISAAAVAVILLVAVGVGVTVQLLQSSNKNKGSTDFTASDSGLPEAIDKAQTQAINGKSDDAHKILNDAITDTTDNSKKRDLYVQQGITYENQQQYDQALAAYKQAEQLGITSTVAQRIAEVAQVQNNNTLAIEYYKKAITLLDVKSPLYDADKKNFQDTIVSLGGQL